MNMKIERFNIPFVVWEEQIIDDEYLLSVFNRCAKWAHRKTEQFGEVVQSNPLHTLSFQYSEIIEAIPRIRHCGLTCSRDDVTDQYQFFATKAPSRYDYDYVINIGTLYGSSWNKEERFIAIPKESADYQTDRYRSGLFAVRKLK